MNLEAQVAHAKALLGNGPRIQELMTERETALATLGEIETELSALLAEGQQELPLETSKRTAQTCSKCGQAGHSKRTCNSPAQGG